MGDTHTVILCLSCFEPRVIIHASDAVGVALSTIEMPVQVPHRVYRLLLVDGASENIAPSILSLQTISLGSAC